MLTGRGCGAFSSRMNENHEPTAEIEMVGKGNELLNLCMRLKAGMCKYPIHAATKPKQNENYKICAC